MAKKTPKRKLKRPTKANATSSPKKKSAAVKKTESIRSKVSPATKLLIVESPTKVRTIKKILGTSFNIIASRGHVRDLLKTGERKMGINVHGDFQGEYGEIEKKKKFIHELRQAASSADEIYLAPDPDREGEAIAWHIKEILRSDGKNNQIFRVSFNEITPRAVQDSLKNPRRIDQRKVNAQETRRKLDRIVGFKLSGEILWNKVAFGLSAGRVQSVALRLISERETEINAFEPTEYWTITSSLEKPGAVPPFEAKLHRIEGEEPIISDEKRAHELAAIIERSTLKVAKTEHRERRRRPPPPFITSTLQQECSTKLRYGAKRTMSIAQSLYEGVNLGQGQGNVGLITYMRTDSVRLAPESLSMARNYISKNYSSNHLPKSPQTYKSKKKIQDAHEAIRPTDIALTPDKIKDLLKPEQLAIYSLIWRRFLASQMAPALFDQTTVDIASEGLTLRATGSVMKFSGFLELYQDKSAESRTYSGPTEKSSTASSKNHLLPTLEKGNLVSLITSDAAPTGVLPEQHFTQPPPRYTEAALVKELEEDGVGRPSTYATILDTLQKRKYVVMERKNRNFTPTSMGIEVNKLLIQGFPEEIDVKFTAKIENALDDIENGELPWLPMLQKFYTQFDKKIQAAKTSLPNLKTKTEPIGRDCPECKNPLVKRFSRNGWFVSCSAYPDCMHSENITEKGEENETAEEFAQIEEKAPPCEECGEPMRVKRGPYGLYLGCSGQPKEHKTRKLNSSGDVVEKPISTGISCARRDCDGELVSRRSRRTSKIFYGCDQFPKCKYVVWDIPVSRTCPTCDHPHITLKTTKKTGTRLVCPVNSCDYKEKAPPSIAIQIAQGNSFISSVATEEFS